MRLQLHFLTCSSYSRDRPPWLINPRRSWGVTVQACRPESSPPSACRPPVGLLRSQPTCPSIWPVGRHSGRLLEELAEASFSQRSWSAVRTRKLRMSVLILLPRLEALFITHDLFLESLEKKLQIFLFWANHGCKGSPGPAPPGWNY